MHPGVGRPVPPAWRRMAPAFRREAAAYDAATRWIVINLKKVRRLYLEEGCSSRHGGGGDARPPCGSRRPSSAHRTRRWAMDLHARRARDRAARCASSPGGCLSRECVALAVAKSFRGPTVARMLSDAGEQAGGLPTDHPVRQRDRVHLDGAGSLGILEPRAARLQPAGQTVDNSVCEAFNGSLRRECLTRRPRGHPMVVKVYGRYKPNRERAARVGAASRRCKTGARSGRRPPASIMPCSLDGPRLGRRLSSPLENLLHSFRLS